MERFTLLLLAGIAVAPSISPKTGTEIAAFVGAATTAAAAKPASNLEPLAQPHERRDHHQADDGLFYVEALVDGSPIRFVVDTGASVVVLTADDAETIGVKSSGGLRVETAGGSTNMRRVKLGKVTLAGRTLTGVDAAVVADNLKVSLLGQNVLSQLDSVTMTGQRLRLN